MTTHRPDPGNGPLLPPPPVAAELPADADADFKGSLVAIRRAAVRARLLAAQTGTDLILARSGCVVRVAPDRELPPQ